METAAIKTSTIQTAAIQTARIEPLDAPLGARVEGLDRAAPWDAQTSLAVQQAFLDHHILLFPGVCMEPRDVLAFARRFGEPISEVNREKRLGEIPEVSRLDSTIKAIEKDKDLLFDQQSALRNEGWHSDQSFVERPAKATILHAHEVPSRGGATWFCNTAGAYDALPEEKKQRLAGLMAVHGYDTRRARYRPAVRSQAEIDETPDVIHPLVRTHPESGRKVLFLNLNRLDRILGLERAESDALLDELAAWVTQERFVYRHQWSVGDVLVWDNRCTMHRVSYDSPAGDRRIMYRVVTQGDRPY